jgi:hypothetical protein
MFEKPGGQATENDRRSVNNFQSQSSALTHKFVLSPSILMGIPAQFKCRNLSKSLYLKNRDRKGGQRVFQLACSAPTNNKMVSNKRPGNHVLLLNICDSCGRKQTCI